MKKRREIRVTLIQKIRFRVKPCYSEERIKKNSVRCTTATNKKLARRISIAFFILLFNDKYLNIEKKKNKQIERHSYFGT